MSEPSVLHATDIHKYYRSGKEEIYVLRGIEFRVSRGEIVCVIGASGVGKSTLLHILGGLLRPDRGQVICEGVSLYEGSSRSRLPRLRNRFFGFVFQFHYLMPEFTAYENVLMPALIGRVRSVAAPKGEVDQAAYLLERVGLKDRMTHKPNQLSGGEQQRVAIARALMNQPKVVLADEPTGNLDEATSVSLVELLKELDRDLGVSFVVATHNMAIARESHRVVEIARGGIFERRPDAGIAPDGKRG